MAKTPKEPVDPIFLPRRSGKIDPIVFISFFSPCFALRGSPGLGAIAVGVAQAVKVPMET